MHHPKTDTSLSSPHWGEKEQIVSTPIPLITGTMLPHNSGIPASVDNPVSFAQADGNSSMSYVWSG